MTTSTQQWLYDLKIRYEELDFLYELSCSYDVTKEILRDRREEYSKMIKILEERILEEEEQDYFLPGMGKTLYRMTKDVPKVERIEGKEITREEKGLVKDILNYSATHSPQTYEEFLEECQKEHLFSYYKNNN